MNNALTKFIESTNRNLENKVYDYLILTIDKSNEIKELISFIEKEMFKIDLYFFINTRFKKKKLYLQVSDLPENKKIMMDKLKSIHNYWRITFNKDISFKKSSKHSVYFDAKNFITKTIKNNQNINFLGKLNILDENINDFQILINLNDNLLSINKIEIKDEYKKV